MFSVAIVRNDEFKHYQIIGGKCDNEMITIYPVHY